MSPAKRILLAARLWLHQSESGTLICDSDDPNAFAAVIAEIEKTTKNKENDMTIKDHYNQRQQSSPSNPLPSIGRDNQLIMDSMTRAKKVAVMLGRAGHRVLDINIGHRNARLTISASNRCNMLGGAMIKIVRMNGFEEKTMATNIEGVQVEWTTSNKLSRAFNE